MCAYSHVFLSEVESSQEFCVPSVLRVRPVLLLGLGRLLAVVVWQLLVIFDVVPVVMQCQVPTIQTAQKTVEVIQLVPQERIQERIAEQVVDIPLPQIMEEMMKVVLIIPRTRQNRTVQTHKHTNTRTTQHNATHNTQQHTTTHDHT